MRMRILPDSHLTEAVDVIRRGGIVAHATETCYGFACDLTNPVAVERLFALKKRPRTMPVSALFPSFEEAKKWVEWNAVAEELAQEHLPGPLTIVLPSTCTHNDITLYRYPSTIYWCAVRLFWRKTMLGVRVSSSSVAHALAELTVVPLSTTSANLHGQPEPYGVEEIVRQFLGEELQPDLILDSGELPHAKPSTVVVIRREKVRVVRQGNVVLEWLSHGTGPVCRTSDRSISGNSTSFPSRRASRQNCKSYRFSREFAAFHFRVPSWMAVSSEVA